MNYQGYTPYNRFKKKGTCSICQQPYRVGHRSQEVIWESTDKKLEACIIKPAQSKGASCIVPIPKRLILFAFVYTTGSLLPPPYQESTCCVVQTIVLTV